MTQDEVNLLYEYLHEHYKYEDGELIRTKKTLNGPAPVGHKLGSMFTPSNKGRPNFRAAFTLNGKRYTTSLDILIFIYHHKYKPKVIVHKDNNPLNNEIENLIETNSRSLSFRNAENFKGVKIYHGKKGIRYYPRLLIGTKETTLGGFDSFEEAREEYLKAKKEYSK
jgi:hypothetical protein